MSFCLNKRIIFTCRLFIGVNINNSSFVGYLVCTLPFIHNHKSFKDISLLIGSCANYAGDGPTKRINSLQLNGFKILKTGSRFYIDEINDAVLLTKYNTNAIHVGDEVIKLNDVYCEHIGNVRKYIETTQITKIYLRNKVSGICYTQSMQDDRIPQQDTNEASPVCSSSMLLTQSQQNCTSSFNLLYITYLTYY